MSNFETTQKELEKQFQKKKVDINECYVASTYIYKADKRIIHQQMTVKKLNEWLG